MVREFKIINEKGQEFSLMDIQEYCLLTDPTDLGISYTTEYEQVGNNFILNKKNIEQKNPSGTLNFINYDNYYKFINFIESSKSLKLYYKVPFENSSPREYYKDIDFALLEKTEIKPEGVISELVTFNSLSLWYEENETTYDITAQENEMRYDYRWDSRYTTYNKRSIVYDNKGHVEAPIKVEIDGYIENPSIQILVDNEVVSEITVPVIINDFEKFCYSSKTGDIYIKKQKADGTFENLFVNEYIDISNNNIFKLPIGASEIRLVSDEEITSAKLTVYPQYKAV